MYEGGLFTVIFSEKTKNMFFNENTPKEYFSRFRERV